MLDNPDSWQLIIVPNIAPNCKANKMHILKKGNFLYILTLMEARVVHNVTLLLIPLDFLGMVDQSYTKYADFFRNF